MNDGKEKTLDLCVGCAYERAILNQGNKNTEQIKIVQKGSSRKIANSSTNTSNKKYLEFGKNAKEFATKFLWSKIIEDYKKILN